jgi:hypothetical protein
MLERHPKEGEVPAMKGSVVIAMAESAEAVREQLCKDIYATTGVWDVDNVNYPFPLSSLGVKTDENLPQMQIIPVSIGLLFIPKRKDIEKWVFPIPLRFWELLSHAYSGFVKSASSHPIWRVKGKDVTDSSFLFPQFRSAIRLPM